MNDPAQVMIEIGMGPIQLDIETSRAPSTTANFLKYVDGNFYDGGRFHRTVRPDNQPHDAIRIEVFRRESIPKLSTSVRFTPPHLSVKRDSN